MQNKFQRSFIALVVASTLGGASTLASAAGVALIEQSGSGMGNAFAGAAATAEDASTVFFNPASMSQLPAQAVLAGHAIDLSAKFSNTGTSQNIGGPTTGGNGGDAGGVAFLPNVYVVMPVNDRLSVGVGVNAPFGLTTEYDSNWVGRYQGIKSELTSYNINPSASYKISDAVSVGAGVNYQHLKANLTNAVFTGGPDALASLNANDDAWGWNVGALVQVTPDTRIGASYRSKLNYTLSGTSTVTTASGATLASNPVNADISLPDTFSLSIAHALNEKWQLLGDVTYTHWSTIQNVNLVNTANGTTADTLAFKFDNTWRVSLGTNYRYSETWTFKGGVAWDQTPVQDQFRTVRLPDNNRTWLALGAKYRFSGGSAFDVGYAHLFLSDGSINNTKAQPGGPFSSTVVGNYQGSVDILSVQYTYTF